MKPNMKTDTIMPKYTAESGRQIYRSGQPFISINREGKTEPFEANEITKRITNMLNIADILEINPLLNKQN